MALFELSSEAISGLERIDFAAARIRERNDLQRLLRDHVHVVSPDTLIISEEFSRWDRSDLRIDLLGVDRKGRLVVLELKRTTDDRLADLQALRYAAMVSHMTFEEAVDIYKDYATRREMSVDAGAALLDFLGWSDPSDGRFNEDVRIVLAAADFSPEVTSTVLWLNERDLDITCVRIQPYQYGTSILLDVQQIIPLPEAADYQVQIRQKQREARTATEHASDWTRYDVTTDGSVRHALYKREVVLAAVRQLVTRGKSPEEIEQTAGRTIFAVVDREIGAAYFQEELARRHPNNPQVVKRFYAREDQLFHAAGRTYALTNQWGKPGMEKLLASFRAAYGDYGFSHEASVEPREGS